MDWFHFKQFSIQQQSGVMRVNTDGVLLGALAEMSDVRHMLDIGTGTGVIALMGAQRFPEARIHAIDIDTLAAQCAAENFQLAAFSAHMQAFPLSMEQFKPEQPYQLIVSNPPFFVADLKNPDPHKRRQRHTDPLFFQVLFAQVHKWLDHRGRFYVIWPPHVRTQMLPYAKQAGLHAVHEITLHSFQDKPAFRVISAYSGTEQAFTSSPFVIYNTPGEYSPAYKELLGDFLQSL